MRFHAQQLTIPNEQISGICSELKEHGHGQNLAHYQNHLYFFRQNINPFFNVKMTSDKVPLNNSELFFAIDLVDER